MNGLVVNTMTSTPLCQNCFKTQLYCESLRDDPSPRKCCEVCEHNALPADLRPRAVTRRQP